MRLRRPAGAWTGTAEVAVTGSGVPDTVDPAEHGQLWNQEPQEHVAAHDSGLPCLPMSIRTK